MQSDRREFLKNVGGVTAAVVAGSSLAQPASVQAEQLAGESPEFAPMALRRPPGRVRIGLFLDGAEGKRAFAGWVSSADGGGAVGEVVVEKIGLDRIAHKHIAGVKYEDITVTCGTGMSKAFYEWIKASFDGTVSRQTGAITALKYDGSVVSTLEFTKALVSEVEFPALDASSKDAAKMTIKFSPEFTRSVAGAGEKLTVPPGARRRWLVSDFKIEIEGVGSDTTSVQKIDAITVKASPLAEPAVNPGGVPAENLTVDVGDLGVTLPDTRSSEFYKWNQDLLTQNNADNGDAGEKAGVLQFLSPDLQQTYFTLSFGNLGAYKVTQEKVEAGSENVRRVTAALYCETVKFDYLGSST